jgi:2',3'-cyclic-nucleotide 2'-phosphodiesterase/3'-nucleotidase
MENASLSHLAAVDGIDAVLTGHHHLRLSGPSVRRSPGVDAEKGTLLGKPAVMAGLLGLHLGLIDLMIERDGNSWRIAGFPCRRQGRSTSAGRTVQ